MNVCKKCHQKYLCAGDGTSGNYTADLNAVREAELKAVEVFGALRFFEAITNTIFNKSTLDIAESVQLITATADQRARAIYSLIQDSATSAENK